MKTAPLKLTDLWLHRLAHNDEARTQALRAVPCDISVRMEVVAILHHGPDLNHRPYLHLRGQIVRVVPDVTLPFGITELPFRSGSEPGFDAFYEFDTEQLIDLLRKGYFGPRFRVPESMTGIVWELPAVADFLLVEPDGLDQPPVVFVGVRDQNSAEFDEENSGYTLAEYFPDFSAENSVQAVVETQPVVPTHSDEIEDLFADEEFDEVHRGPAGLAQHVPASVRGVAEQIPKSVFDHVLAEVEAQHRAEEPAKQPGVDYVPESPEGLLRERIRPGVEAALSEPFRSATSRARERGTDRTDRTDRGSDPDGFLDLDD